MKIVDTYDGSGNKPRVEQMDFFKHISEMYPRYRHHVKTSKAQ